MKRVLIPVLLVIASVALLSTAWNQYAQRQALIDDGTQVTGTVVGINTTDNDDGDPTYAPIYEYEVDGTPLRHSPGVHTSSRPVIGATEQLYVDPDDATHVIANTFADRWFAPMMFAIFGVVVLVIAIVLGWTQRYISRKRQELGPHTANHDSHAPVTMSTASAASRSKTTGSVESSGPFVSGADAPTNGPFS